ncbi:hypothetical protein [Sphingobium fuliginis]|jgi:DnaJ-class molecular chaperone|uniref:hypothetical protein n=1 Tax=Sphingobium fuliginis (strain ATCC 27551) TaxID=336203 RepID=UPI0037C7AE57
MAIRDYDGPSVECDHCAGHGWVQVRRFGIISGVHEEDCPICCGHGWRPMTDDELADAAEAQGQERIHDEPPITMAEQSRRAWEHKHGIRA